MGWLDAMAEGVEAQVQAEEAAATAAAIDDNKAHSVGLGLHIRGRSAFKEGLTDEGDPARFLFHKALSQAAQSGDWMAAEATVAEMAQAGYVPGPRAYHAVVFSYVKARNAPGALGAIRQCWDAGITPLPETYAAVVAAHVAVGDLDTAEAVCASNRRAGVDYTKSWQQLVAALLRLGEQEKAAEMISQGEAERLQPSEAIYEALIQQLSAAGDLGDAMELLQAMKMRGMRPSLSVYEPLITQFTVRGNLTDAQLLLKEFVGMSSMGLPAGTQAVCYTVFEAQVLTSQSIADVEECAQGMKLMLLRRGAQPGQRFYIAQLEAALRLGDVLHAVQTLRTLRNRAASPLHRLSDDVLAQLLLQLSRASMPAELYEVLSAMSRESRSIPAAAMQPDEHGCTVLGAWVHHRIHSSVGSPMQGEVQGPVAGAEQSASSGPIDIDGVAVDPLLLSVLDAAGNPLAVSRMTVKELRAELAARRAPVTGNKKDLAKRLQKLRQLDGTRTTSLRERLRSEQKGSNSARKVAIIVTERNWGDGEIVQETRYEDERELQEVLEEEGEDAAEVQDWDVEDEEGAPSSRRAAQREEEDLFDDEADLLAATNEALAEGRTVLAITPHFTSRTAGPHEAATMVLGVVVDLRAQPSAADLRALAAYVRQAEDVPAAVLLAAALDQLPDPDTAGVVAELRADLAALCASHDVDLDAAIEVVLKKSEPELGDADGELAEIMAELTFAAS